MIDFKYTGVLNHYQDGILTEKHHLLNGVYHCEDAPAIELFYTACHCEDCKNEVRWFLFGEELTFNEFWERQKDTEHAAKIMAYVLGQQNAEEEMPKL